MNNPNWDTHIDTICSNLSLGTCFSAGVLGSQSSAAVESLIHYAECGIEGRFQEYIEVEEYFAGDRQSSIIDLT